jgi:hypothetical protein
MLLLRPNCEKSQTFKKKDVLIKLNSRKETTTAT